MLDIDTIDAARERIDQATDLEDLVEKLFSPVQEIGFSHVAITCHVHSANQLVLPMVVDNYPENWRQLLAWKSRIMPDDPVVLAAQQRGGAFRWADIESIIPLTSAQRKFLLHAISIGMASGCTISSQIPYKPTISAHLVVKNGAPLEKRTFMVARLLGTAAIERARDLWQAQLFNHIRDSAERLSPRQVDCIKLVARGLTSKEIADKLGISEQTVSEYINDARRRLGVGNRAQLVLKSLQQGYFLLDDVVE